MLSLALPGNMQGANPTSQFLLASVILIVLFAINIVRPKIAYKLISIFTVIGIASMLVAVFVLVSSGTNGAVNYVNFFGNSTLTYQGIAEQLSGPSFDWAATLMFVPYFAFFTYPWVNAAPAVASEIKGKSALKWNVRFPTGCCYAISYRSVGSMYYAGGMAFVNAALANPTLVYNYSFNFWTFAMGATTNPILSWIIGIGWILWIINILAVPSGCRRQIPYGASV